MTKHHSKKADSKLPKVNWKVIISLAPFGVVLLLIGSYLFFELQDRIFPGVYVNQINLSGLTQDQAKQVLTSELNHRLEQSVGFHFQAQSYQLQLDNNLYPTTLIDQAVDQALAIERTQLSLLPTNLEVLPDSTSLSNQVKAVASAVNIPAVNSQLTMSDEDINLTPSQNGTELDQSELAKLISSYLITGQLQSDTLPTRTVTPVLTYQDGLTIRDALLKLKLQPLQLVYKDKKFSLDLPTALNLINLKDARSIVASINQPNQPLAIASTSTPTTQIRDIKLVLDQARLNDYLQQLSQQLDQPVKEPLFNFDGSKVTEFRPPQEGLTLDINQTAEKINQYFLTANPSSTIELAVNVTEPKNQLTNQLGIKELLGEGVSYFSGSIPNRIFNIQLAASRINGVIIPPGETFSYLDTVGDISAATGFKQGYVIKNGRTVLDDGGGVCQDSTTLFRAALNAGLPIVARTAHAYRVGYYEQGFPPGIDATVFSPTVDFKFKNDTPASILIQANATDNSLVIDLYGTSDGRVAQISQPVITNQTPPPPDLRQDDPTLPKGTVKQVDYAAWGASVSFKRTVTRDNQMLINETWRSNYQPWQAVYLVGTGV